jgi:hypothetical protein
LRLPPLGRFFTARRVLVPSPILPTAILPLDGARGAQPSVNRGLRIPPSGRLRTAMPTAKAPERPRRRSSASPSTSDAESRSTRRPAPSASARVRPRRGSTPPLRAEIQEWKADTALRRSTPARYARAARFGRATAWLWGSRPCRTGTVAWNKAVQDKTKRRMPWSSGLGLSQAEPAQEPFALAA